MSSLRASFSIEPDILLRFNEVVPSGERSRLIQTLMAEAIGAREKALEEIAAEFETHPDFAEARAISLAFDAAIADGLNEYP